MTILLVFYLLLYLYLDQVIPNENGLSKDPLFFLKKAPKREIPSPTNRDLQNISGIDLGGLSSEKERGVTPYRRIIEVKRLVKQF